MWSRSTETPSCRAQQCSTTLNPASSSSRFLYTRVEPPGGTSRPVSQEMTWGRSAAGRQQDNEYQFYLLSFKRNDNISLWKIGNHIKYRIRTFKMLNFWHFKDFIPNSQLYKYEKKIHVSGKHSILHKIHSLVTKSSVEKRNKTEIVFTHLDYRRHHEVFC